MASVISQLYHRESHDSDNLLISNPIPEQHSLLHPIRGSKFWQDDSTCPACSSCGQPFSFFIRRHHCRLCGFIFCASCSARQVPGPENSYPDQPMVRACLTCFTYYRASKIPRSKLTVMTVFPTLREFKQSEPVSAESKLNPAMKLLIDSMDTYDNRTRQQQSKRKMVLSRSVSDNKLFLLDMYNNHLRHVIKQLLIRNGLEYQIWLETIVQFAIHCGWNLQPLHSDGNISELVKIVGVASGAANESALINGIVLSGLNVIHRKMATVISDPYILLIDGALAPKLTQMPALVSLRSIPSPGSYNKVFIEKLLILCPDVIICREMISLQAARIFQDHGISVICGVSKSDLATLRRALHVRILNATTLMNASVDCEEIYGRCESFSIEKYDVASCDLGLPSATKTTSFLKLSGVGISYFATLLLHNVPNLIQLATLESIAKTAVFLAWSLSHEISYVSDSSATILPEQTDNGGTIATEIPEFDNDCPSEKSFWEPLSSSPVVASVSFKDNCEHSLNEEENVNRITSGIQVSTGELNWSLNFGIYWTHKEISASQKHVVCFQPRTIRTTFYGAIDSSLGEFLLKTCFNIKRYCSCGRSMLDHRCCIVHGNGRLIIEVDTLPQPLLQDYSDGIVSWLWCSECRGRSSPVTVLSNRALRLSLTKYFESCFYDYKSSSRLDSCGHRIHRDMIRCFAFDNLIATVQYSMAVPFELSLLQHVAIPHYLSARTARLELSRLVTMTSLAQELALRQLDRDAPSFVIDSAFDIIRDKIMNECKQIKESAMKLSSEDVGLLRARQLYLQLFRAASSWLRRDNHTEKIAESPVKSHVLQNLLKGCTRSILILAKWDIPTTFGGRIVPIVRSQVATIVSHALASLHHAAFIMGKRSIADIPSELRHTPLEEVLQSSLLPASSDGSKDNCEIILRSVKQSSTSKFSVSIDCGDAGRVWVGFAPQFQALRHCLCGSNYAVIDSLGKSRDWEAKGGKSNASFIRTWDHRLILKRINATEAKTFSNIAAEYFKYIANHIFQGHPSALTPILGIFEVCSSNTSKFYILMPNLLNDPLIDHVFDLKGKASGRLVRNVSPSERKTALPRPQQDSDWMDITSEDFMNSSQTGSGQVLQDENFALFTQGDPLPILPESFRLLNDALDNDARFLTDLGIMDYSVLIGVRKTPPQRLFVGIIDYIRFYTLDKKVENTVKSFIEKDAPTILPPVLYMQRFLDSMHRSFVCAPNRECSPESMPVSALDVDPEDFRRIPLRKQMRNSLPQLNDTVIFRRHSSNLNGIDIQSTSFYKEI